MLQCIYQVPPKYASLRKRLTAEMPQKKRKPLKRRFFLVVSLISVINTEIPQNPVLEGFPFYFEAFPKIFEESPLFNWQIFLRDFPIFLRCSAKCLRFFSIFKTLFSWGVSCTLVEVLPQNIWGLSVFLKTLFSWGVSAKFLRHFRIFKNSI